MRFPARADHRVAFDVHADSAKSRRAVTLTLYDVTAMATTPVATC
jgi:hypothetical protein